MEPAPVGAAPCLEFDKRNGRAHNSVTMSKRTAGSVYSIRYHMVWCPKYRRPVLVGEVADALRDLLTAKVTELGGEVLALEVMPDHVHLFVEMPPSFAPAQIAFRLKGYTSHALREMFPWLKSRLPSLWSRSYYVGTAGHVSEETIKKYIAAQKRAPRKVA